MGDMRVWWNVHDLSVKLSLKPGTLISLTWSHVSSLTDDHVSVSPLAARSGGP
jgi:hypothetical protein